MRILIIEDNPGDARLIREMLSEVNGDTAELEWEETLASGLERLVNERFDALLLDLALPDSQGLETLKEVSPFEQPLPIVILTELEDDETARQALEGGAQDYLVKWKISADSLGRSIRYAIERHSTGEALLAREEQYRLLVDLRKHEERYRALFESSRDAQMTLAPPSWTFTYCNPAALEMFGVKDEGEIVSAGPWDLSPDHQPDGKSSEAKARQNIGTALQEGVFLFDWTHKRPNGEEFPVTVLLTRMEIGGETVVQSSVRDMTELKAAQEELRNLAESYRIVADFTYDWEWLLAPDREYLYVSPSCERITGYSREEFINEPGLLLRIVHPEDREAVEKHLEKTRSARDPRSIDFRIIRPDGGMRWIGQWCQQVLDADGNVLASRASNRDITNLKVVEQEVTRHGHKLIEESDSVRARIAADLHDGVGQSLNVIKMAFDLHYKKMANTVDEETHDRMDSIREMLSETIDRVRNIAIELVPAALTDLGLESALQNYLEDFARDTGATCELKTEGTGVEVRVEVKTALFRIAQEALTNVRKHSGASSVTISISWSESLVSLSIRDDGVGFNVERAYGETRAGEHFGLVAMRERARMRNGQFTVESEPGAGTTVTVTVPLEHR